MGIGSLKDLYLDELADLYDAETQMIRTLPRLADAAQAPELKDALAKHSSESRLHLERLQLIFTHWGERLSSRPCGGLAGIVQEGDDRLNQLATPDARDAAIIGIAQRIEHYEIAAYGCARAYARRLNRADEARLLQETLDEEGRADRRLTEIADSHVNDDARTETDFRPHTSSTRLRYVGARQMNDVHLSDGAIEVRNDREEELGTFDGLIVDVASNRPSYVVVDARGLMWGRRYLLPVAHVRFDDSTRHMHVDLAKDVAERYPPFDPDEFQTMDEDALSRYERRLLESFPREGKSSSGTRAVAESGPDWLMTGVWITVPPETAERLPEEARAFANEFAPVKDAEKSKA